jgi:hypothetical protein
MHGELPTGPEIATESGKIATSGGGFMTGNVTFQAYIATGPQVVTGIHFPAIQKLLDRMMYFSMEESLK